MNHDTHRVIPTIALLTLAGVAFGQAKSLEGLASTYASTGVLELTTNDQQQQIEIEIGPVAGEVRVWGIDGIPSGFTFTEVAAVDLMTGAAHDYVEFRYFGTEAMPVRIDTGFGTSDVKMIYFIPFGVEPFVSEVSIIGGPDGDKAAFEVFSDTDNFQGYWDVRHFEGDNETTAVVDSIRPSDLLVIDLSSASRDGQDKIDADIKSAAAVQEVTVAGRMGGGNDTATVKIDEQNPAAVGLHFDLSMGAGEDAAEGVVVLRGGMAAITGAMRGGADLDVLKFLLEGDGASNVSLIGGAGVDYLDMEYKGLVNGSPRLLGGQDNDFLKIVAEQPGAMTPLLNGGPGFDEAIGFGVFRNVESIN